ncbi:MAG TPA: NTP transferase domain-containing protein [Labilithrix sp.]
MIDKAVILAAGIGKRMSPGGEASRAGGVPKPLLPLDASGVTFLDWHVRALRAAGAKEITIVGSPATFGKKDGVRWVMNDFPGDQSGSGHSTHLAFTSDPPILDGRSRVVLMDADVVYDATLFADLANAPGARSKTLVCGRFRETAEEVMVFADAQGKPRVHGKGLLGTPLVSGLSCLGEATGLLLLEPGDHASWRAASAWCMQYLTSKTRSEHEDITQRLMLVSALDAVVFTDDTRFMECDTPEEYEVARREMVPRWLPHLPRPG